MRKINIVFIILLLALLIPSAVQAQRPQNIRFESLSIDLWPEYDQPAMLVIYRAVLASDVSLPADLSFRIPASVGQPNAVAIRSPGEPLMDAPFESQVLGEWAYINLTVEAREIQIEYYDDNIARDGISREYIFNWPGDYAADSVTMLVQQPTGVESMTTQPRLNPDHQDRNGLIYYGGEIGAVAAGETFSLTVYYEKDTDDLTVFFLPVESSAPLDVDTPGRMSADSALPWAMGILGMAVIAFGIYWYWFTGSRGKRKSRRKPAKQSNRQRSKPRKRVLEPELQTHEADEPSIFCHQCGKRAVAKDKFCRSCGTRLKQ